MILQAQPLTPSGFAPFGRVLDLRGEADFGIATVSGEGWRDSYTLAPLIDGQGHLGMTLGPSAPWECRQMERHPRTEEALFCAGAPIVLAVAPPGEAPAPQAGSLQAFVLQPGQVAVMSRGVWHDACRGLAGPTPYHWMAICGLGPDPWVAVEGGPVRVQA